MILSRILTVSIVAVLVPVVTFTYLRLGERALGHLPNGWRRRLTPWLFLAPTLVVVVVTLLGPAMATVVLSVLDADSASFVGTDNYRANIERSGSRDAFKTTGLWVLILPIAASTIGLAVAEMTDRVRYGGLVRAALFLPIAISGVAAAVIWSGVFRYRPTGSNQTGVLNAILTSTTTSEPISWLIDKSTNNYALIAAAIWTQAGFAMVIFSAALRGVDKDVKEAARLDGASEFQLFRLIILPTIRSTVIVVMTTMTIIALKAFDIIYVMTAGRYGTDVMSTLMYRELFTAKDNGTASSIAVILMLAVIPIMAFNLSQFRRGQASS